MRSTQVISLSLLAFIFLNLLSKPIKAGNPWVRPAKSGYVHLGGSFNQYSNYHNGFVKFASMNRRVTDFGMHLYSEIGLPKRFMVSFSLPVYSLTSGQEVLKPNIDSLLAPRNLFGTGNISLEGQYQFYNRKGLVLAAGFRFIGNTSLSKASIGLRTGYAAWGFAPNISLGYSWGKSYFKWQSDLVFRTHGYSEQFQFAGEMGWRLGKRFILATSLSGMVSFRNGAIEYDAAEQYALYPDTQTWIAVMIKGGVSLPKRFGLWLSAGGGAGEGVPTGVPVSLTLSWEWGNP